MANLITINNLLEKLARPYRARYWSKICRARLRPEDRLSPGQEASVREFLKPYPKVSADSHRFYAGRTGSFDVRYIPDPLWYGYIDVFYNPVMKSRVMDNKCLYDRILPPPDYKTVATKGHRT